MFDRFRRVVGIEWESAYRALHLDLGDVLEPYLGAEAAQLVDEMNQISPRLVARLPAQMREDVRLAVEVNRRVLALRSRIFAELGEGDAEDFVDAIMRVRKGESSETQCRKALGILARLRMVELE